MMKLMKKCICIIGSFLLIFTNVSVHADNTEEKLDKFLAVVESSDYYSDFEMDIIDQEALKSADTEEGLRYTISYNLEPHEYLQSNLIIIGDKDFNIIGAFKINYTENAISVNELHNNITSTLNAGRRGPVRECLKMVCTEWETNYDWVGDSFCSATIGTACSGFTLIGFPVLSIVCKAGVIIGCNFKQSKVCVDYYEEFTVCPL